VIVRVHRTVIATSPAEGLVGQVRQYLVRVHVVGGPRSSLERINDELVVVASAHDLGGGGGDSVGKRRVEQAKFAVHLGCRALYEGSGPDVRLGLAEMADGIVLDGALRLGAPESIIRDLDLTE